jgi:hypothetical protein
LDIDHISPPKYPCESQPVSRSMLLPLHCRVFAHQVDSQPQAPAAQGHRALSIMVAIRVCFFSFIYTPSQIS